MMSTRVLLFLVISFIFFTCRSSNEEESLDNILWAATWSPDDQYLNIGGNSGKLFCYSGKDFNLIDTISTPQTISNLEWSPDNSVLVVATHGSEETSYIFNPVTREKVYLDSLYESGARGITWKSDGSQFALGDNEGRILIYDKLGNLERVIQADPKSITGIDWHPTRDILVTVGSRLGVYDLEIDSTTIVHPREKEVLMLCVEWHPSGDFFVTGDYGDQQLGLSPLLQFWGPGGEKINEITGMKSEIRRIIWTDDGEELAVASNMAFLFDVNGTMIRQNDLGSQLWGIDWNSQGTQLVTSTQNGSIYILNDKLQVVRKIQ